MWDLPQPSLFQTSCMAKRSYQGLGPRLGDSHLTPGFQPLQLLNRCLSWVMREEVGGEGWKAQEEVCMAESEVCKPGCDHTCFSVSTPWAAQEGKGKLAGPKASLANPTHCPHCLAEQEAGANGSRQDLYFLHLASSAWELSRDSSVAKQEEFQSPGGVKPGNSVQMVSLLEETF